MKLIMPFALLALLSCNNSNKNEPINMPGAYNMIFQSVDDGKKDTVYTTLKEFKIYTDDYFMYVNFNPKDSVSRFGVGYYTVDSGKVVESLIYGASDTSYSDNPATYHLTIENKAKGYKQIIPELISQGIKYKLTEEYESVGTATKSPLDGVWKETQSYTINGKDTIKNKVTQYKVYYSGHFMYGNSARDSANVLHTSVGYGNFEMNGPDKVKEYVTTSSYYQARGKTYDLDIEMKGPDGYIQTIIYEDGTKGVEEYQRLKKS